MNSVQLKSIFSYHAPHSDQAQRYEKLRAGGLQLATLINDLTPESPEKTLAIRRVQEAVMYANAAIACNESQPHCALCGGAIGSGERFEPVADGRVAHTACIDRRAR